MKRKIVFTLSFLFLWMGLAWSQDVTVKGVVTSAEDGFPVVGASVLVKGITTGTITDIDGNFNLSKVPASATHLVISFIGMVSQEVAIIVNQK